MSYVNKNLISHTFLFLCHIDSGVVGLPANLTDETNHPQANETASAVSNPYSNSGILKIPRPAHEVSMEEDVTIYANDTDQSSSNDVTAHNSHTFGSFEIPPTIQEDSIPDAVPRNIAPEEFPCVIEYQTIECSSQRRKSKLVDNIGYSYTVKRKYGEDNIVWRCTVRNKTTTCLATVRQHGTTYTPGVQKHCHQPSAGAGTAAKVSITTFYFYSVLCQK